MSYYNHSSIKKLLLLILITGVAACGGGDGGIGNAVDTDGDGLSDTQEATLGTSELLVDTDGDGMSDGDEHTNGGFNPLVADLPLLNIEVTGSPTIQLDVTETSTTNTLGSYTATYAQGSSNSYSRSDSVATSSSIEATVSVSNEVEASAEIGSSGGKMGASNKTTASASVTASVSRDTSTTVDTASETSSEQEYANYEQAGHDASTSTESGSISTLMTVTNNSSLAFTISNIRVVAKKPVSGGSTLQPIATMDFGDYGVDENIMAPSQSIEKIALSDAPSVPLLKELMRDPTGIVFSVGEYNLTDTDGNNYAVTAQDVLSKTAQVVIDYGTDTIDSIGNTAESFMVATNVARDANGNTLGITIADVLNNILQLPYETVQKPILAEDGTDTGLTKQVLSSLDGIAAAADVTTGQADRRFWMVYSNSDTLDDPHADFENINLKNGDRITLAYVQDSDRDGLFDREEALLGTSLVLADSDSDGISDYDEVKIGWLVPLASGSYQVYSDPNNADTDGDLLNDLGEMTALLDPRNVDTDGDLENDNTDTLNGFASLSDDLVLTVKNRPWVTVASDYTAVARVDGAVATSNGFLESVIIDWGDGITSPIAVNNTADQSRSFNTSHTYQATGEFTVTVTAVNTETTPQTLTKTFTVKALPTKTNTTNFLQADSWRAFDSIRAVGDVNGDGYGDLIGVASDRIEVMLADGASQGTSFLPIQTWATFPQWTSVGASDPYYRPYYVKDVNSDGKMDVVRFQADGVYMAVANTAGTGFDILNRSTDTYGLDAAWTNELSYPRWLADFNGDGYLDIQGSGSAGVWIAEADSILTYPQNGQYGSVALSDFGSLNTGTAALNWQPNEPRGAADLNNDGRDDIYGFKASTLYTSLSTGDALSTGTAFGPVTEAVGGYGSATGWSSMSGYPRMFEDLDNDGLPDLIGFGQSGLHITMNNTLPGSATADFGPIVDHLSCAFVVCGGWSNQNYSPRYLKDMNGDGNLDIVGFKDKVWVSEGNGDGTYQPAYVFVNAFNSDDSNWNHYWTTGPSLVYNERYVHDVNNDGVADMVGFANTGTVVIFGINVTEVSTVIN